MRTDDDDLESIIDREDVMRSVPEHLRDLVIRCELDGHLKTGALVTEYQDCFMDPNGELGRTNVINHTINTADHAPIKQRRLPQAQVPLVEKEVDKMLKLDVIEPSDSPWSSPTVLVRSPM